MFPAVMEVLIKGCGDCSPSSGGLSGLTWEWREGRLLAFELILRRLVRGHIAHLLQMELRLELKSPDGDSGQESPCVQPFTLTVDLAVIPPPNWIRLDYSPLPFWLIILIGQDSSPINNPNLDRTRLRCRCGLSVVLEG